MMMMMIIIIKLCDLPIQLSCLDVAQTIFFTGGEHYYVSLLNDTMQHWMVKPNDLENCCELHTRSVYTYRNLIIVVYPENITHLDFHPPLFFLSAEIKSKQIEHYSATQK